MTYIVSSGALNSTHSLTFKHDFIRCVDFAHITTSNAASDDVTNYVKHRIFNADLLYYCAHFVVETDEKS